MVPLDKAKPEAECCTNCKNCVAYPKNNRYGDGYYIAGVHKDRNKVRRFTPGGRKLECRYERQEKDSQANKGRWHRWTKKS